MPQNTGVGVGKSHGCLHFACSSQTPLLIQYTIQRSTDLPLVSSFYHIGTVVAREADQLGFFEPGAGEGKEEDTQWLQEEYAVFIERVCGQLRFYKDELLVAAAEFVLTAPLTLIDVEKMVPALLSTLSIGKSYLPAAEIGVSALERWQRAFPAELQRALPDIVPLLKLYLTRPDDEDETMPPFSITSQRASTGVQAEEEGLTDFGRLQRRILVLLGHTGGAGALLISKPSTSSTFGPGASAAAAGRSYVPQFQLSLELSDLSISLSLDKILAQTGNIAANDTNRRLKISACEAYHALVCYLCGQTATHPHASESKSVFHPVWTKVFPSLLVLATDPEKVCRELFEPLLFQVVRWLCSASETHPFEYSMLLDELVVGLSQVENNAVREVSGKAFAALLSASIDHGDNKSDRGLSKAEVLFQRLFSLCRHPSSVQRIGAATAINYVMRTLNQDNSEIISAFALRCVKMFLVSLQLCDRDEHSGRGGMDIARGNIERAVAKLERAIARFPHLFMQNAASTSRSASSTDASLEELTEWLFAQTMKRERAYRSMCQKLFVSFASVVSGGGCKRWLVKYAEQGADVASVLAPMDSLACVLSSLVMGRAADAVTTIDWLERFAASVESFEWCIQLLGEHAAEILVSRGTGGTGGKGSAVKRKSEAMSSATDESGTAQQPTLAWATSAFLGFECPVVSEADIPDAVAYLRYKRVVEVYVGALASLCRLLSLELPPATQSLTWLLDTDQRGFQEQLAKRVIQLLATEAGAQALTSIASTSVVKDFCRAVVKSKSPQSNHLRNAAINAMFDPMADQFRLRQDGTGSSESSSAAWRTSAFVIQVQLVCVSLSCVWNCVPSCWSFRG